MSREPYGLVGQCFYTLPALFISELYIKIHIYLIDINNEYLFIGLQIHKRFVYLQRKVKYWDLLCFGVFLPNLRTIHSVSGISFSME